MGSQEGDEQEGVHIADESIFKQTQPHLIKVHQEDEAAHRKPVKTQGATPMTVDLEDQLDHLERAHQRETPNDQTKELKRVPTPIKKIGHYSIGKVIGEGTFGKVRLGTHNLTKEIVAIKILEKEKICDLSDVERVAREIHILKLIRHPNIIQLYEIIETPKQLYFIMEYADGGELFDYIV